MRVCVLMVKVFRWNRNVAVWGLWCVVGYDAFKCPLKAFKCVDWIFYHVRYKSLYMGLVVRYMGNGLKRKTKIENENWKRNSESKIEIQIQEWNSRMKIENEIQNWKWETKVVTQNGNENGNEKALCDSVRKKPCRVDVNRVGTGGG